MNKLAIFLFSILISSAFSAELCSKNISLEGVRELVTSSLKKDDSNEYKINIVSNLNFNNSDSNLICFSMNNLQLDKYHLQGTLELFGGSNPNKKMDLTATVEEMVKVAVPKENIRKGDKIDRSKIAYKNISRRKLREGTVTDLQKAINQIANRSLRYNLPILEKDLRPSDLVSKNQKVNLYYNNNKISISTAGIALDSGKKDDVISVMNESSKKIIQGKVSAEGSIFVGYN